MSDKQKLLEWLNHYCNDTMTIEEMIDSYIGWHGKEFTAHRLNGFVQMLNGYVIGAINNMELATRIAHERATYLKCYLEGKMYENEEAAKQCVGIQIENAQAILDSTERVAL